MGKHYKSADEHFTSLLRKTDTCWFLTTANNTWGYSKFEHKGIQHSGHVFSYEKYKGKTPSGMEIHHKCEVRDCVNPEHLEATTHKLNLSYSSTNPVAINMTKTHCPQGHEYTVENTYTHSSGRQCRICRKKRTAAHDAYRSLLNASKKA